MFDFPGKRMLPVPGLQSRASWGLDHLPSSFVDATIGEVHAEVNWLISFAEDVGDYWQSSRFTLARRKGDCEDYCVLEHDLLRLLGYEDMAIILGNLIIRRWWRPIKVPHALLFVKTKDEVLVLDNRQRLIKTPASYEDIFAPIYWVNEKGGGVYLPVGNEC